MSDRTRTMLRLGVVLVAFPLLLAYGLRAIPAVDRFFAGDRSAFATFWLIAAALEWLTVALVVATYRRPRTELAEIGVPLPPRRGEAALGIGLLIGAALLALATAGQPQTFLERLPAGLQMFFPPPDLASRLVWVAMAATAAVCEEVLWRAVAISDLRRVLGSTLGAVAISSLAFAFFHGGLEQGPTVFAYRTAVGAAFAAAYLGTRRLTLPIVLHFLADALSLAAVDF